MAQPPQRTDINITEFRHLLEKERKRLTQLHHEQRHDMREESADVAQNELSTADFNELADIGAQEADNDRDKAQDAEVVAQLQEIDKALERIDNGTYGICIVTGEPIPVARLRALPWASMTVEAAERTIQ